MESIFPIECEIPSLKLAVELLPETSSLEECLLHLEHLNEQCRDAATINEAHKKRVKTQYDKVVCPWVFSEGDLVLVYDQDKDALGAGKFKPMWYSPFIIKQVLEKGVYELIDFEGNKLAEPRNELYLKKYFALVVASQWLLCTFCIFVHITSRVCWYRHFLVCCGRCWWMTWSILDSPMVLVGTLGTSLPQLG